MKVLYVSHTSLMSGAEGALLDLLDALPDNISPVVACPPGPLSDALDSRDVEVMHLPEISGSFRLDLIQTPRTVLQLLTAGLALHRIVRAVAPDVVHANSLRSGLVAGAAFASRSAPVIVHAHDALPNTRSAAIVRAALRPTASTLIAISEYTAKNLVDLGFTQPIRILFNPLDTQRFDPGLRSKADARAELGLAPDQLLLGIVAQITPWKGQEIAIRTTGILRETFPSIKLLIVGEAKFTSSAARYDNAEYKRSLHRLITELGLQRNVEFLGERQDVETIIRSLDVVLAPSWEEPFGRTVIEAMSLETPVVSTNVGGPPEYIRDGVEGFLLSPTDAHAWSDTVANLLAHPELRADVGRSASSKVRSLFDRRDYAHKVAAAYQDVLDSSPRSRTRGSRAGPGAGTEPR
jgi:glycosyltransferase involved in cell wall biosynthesis